MARPFAAIVAIVASAALILQLWLIVSGNNIANPDYHPTMLTSIVNFFSYFTILSNIFCALVTGFAALAPRSSWGRFFAEPRVATAIALYIGVTGLIYFFVLRHLWKPVGLQFVADAGLHYVMPPLFFLYWLAVVPKKTLRFPDVLPMLIFPLAYGAYALVRGAITMAVYPAAAWYPYPFLSVPELGYPRTLLNMLGMTILFAIVGLLLIAIDRLAGRAQAR
ncbi:MAG: Pr6Pr family membrane protein [Bauldia sp.]